MKINLIEERYILEFSEKQQCWHLNDGRNIPNTNSYFTIFESITEFEIVEFQKSLGWMRKKQPHLTLEFVKAKAAKWADYK